MLRNFYPYAQELYLLFISDKIEIKIKSVILVFW